MGQPVFIVHGMKTDCDAGRLRGKEKDKKQKQQDFWGFFCKQQLLTSQAEWNYFPPI